MNRNKNLESISTESAAGFEKGESFCQRSEEHYLHLLDNAPILIWECDANELCTYVNKQWLNFTGRCIEDELGVGRIENIHPDDINKYKILLAKKLEEKQPFIAEYRLKRFDGIYRWMQDNIVPRLNANSDLIGFSGGLIDFTDRVEAIENLKQTETTFRGIFNSIEQAIYIQDENGTFLDVNMGVEKMYGYSKEEVIGKGPLFLAADGLNNLIEVSEKVRLASLGEPQQFKFWGKRKNGDIFPKNVHIYKGIYLGKDIVIATAEDISEDVKAEQKLSESEKKYRNIFENVQDVFYRVDKHGIVTDISPSIIKYSGYQLSDILGKKITDFYYYPEDRIKLLQLLSVKGQVTDFEIGLKKIDGGLRYASVNTHFVYDSFGNIIGMEGTMRDISERKKAEQILQTQLQFSRAHSEISDLIVLEDNPQIILEKTSEIIGKTLKLDRALIYDVSFESRDVTAFCEWLNPNAKGITPTKGTYNLSVFEGGANYLFNSKTFLESSDNNINENLISDGSGKVLHKLMSIKSLLWFPFKFRETGFSVLAFNQVQNYRTWSTPELQFIDGVADLLTVALQRMELISEILATENSLKESESNLRTLIESLPDLIFFKDGFGRWLTLNSRSLETFHLVGKNYLGKTDCQIAEIVPEMKDILDYCVVSDELAWRNGQLTRCEESMPDGDGSYLTFDTIKVPLFNPDGSRKGLVIVGRDISERKKSELELLKFSQAVKQSPASIMITNTTGIIEYVNPKFTELTGYLLSEVKGKKSNLLKSNETEEKEYQYLWKTISTGNEWRGEFHNKKKNGELFWESASISPIKNKEGVITHFIAIKEDITEKKNIINELIASKEKAEEMSRLKSSFLANMSHELRTPLIGIMGYAEIMMDDIEDPELIKMAEVIHNSGKRLSDTLNSILDLSKAESNKTEFSLKKIDIVDVCNKACALFAPVARKKNLDFEIITRKSELYADLDEKLILQILHNILNNAIKFTSAGKISVECGLEVTLGSENVYIKINDTGIGIHKQDLSRVFDEFRQASEGFGRSYEGTGLGLTIAKKSCELMNGVISVDSKVGVGSEFKVTFPLWGTRHKISESSKALLKAMKQNPLINQQDLPIALYVDDDKTSQEIVKIFLANICRIDSALNGKTALAMLKENKYDFFLMDINLGRDLNGLQVTSEIRKIPGYETVKVVAVTAFSLLGDKEEFMRRGCNYYISKPFRKTEFIELIKKVMVNG